MVQVRVHRIQSITDPETGLPGKQIELVQMKRRGGENRSGEEARVVQNVLTQFQSMGLVPHVREMALPKITLFLSESEYDLLGIRFEVNDVYELIMKDGYIGLKRPTEGV